MLGDSDKKKRGDLLRWLDLNSPVCLVHFVLPTETAGDAYQTIHCGITLVSACSTTNRIWCKREEFWLSPSARVGARKIKEQLGESLQKDKILDF